MVQQEIFYRKSKNKNYMQNARIKNQEGTSDNFKCLLPSPPATPPRSTQPTGNPQEHSPPKPPEVFLLKLLEPDASVEVQYIEPLRHNSIVYGIVV